MPSFFESPAQFCAWLGAHAAWKFFEPSRMGLRL